MSKISCRVIQIQFDQLTKDELIVFGILNLPKDQIEQIFRSEPMHIDHDYPKNMAIPHDLIFILKENPEETGLVLDVNERFGYVYNCINPSNSDFGVVEFDKDFKYRLFYE
jgi:hypothetical protein